MARLIVHRGPNRLLEFRISAQRALIGRADAADLGLPGDTISRIHCTVQRAPDGGWEVVDRSRHGLRVNGAPVAGAARIAHEDELIVGEYRLVFYTRDAGLATPTVATRGVAPPVEQLLSADDSVSVQRLVLEVREGPDAGRREVLGQPELSVGAPGSDIVLSDPALCPEHVRISVSRGRALIKPGAGFAVLDGERVDEPTPLYLGEDVRIGDTFFRVEAETTTATPRAERFGQMVGRSEAIRQVFGLLQSVSRHTTTVLLTGETGTGKDLAARGIHEASTRADGPFIAVNCAALSASLFESELFGHERGAFTGANAAHVGAWEQADGGTLFLDEIGELPEPAQAKLLRALDSGEIRRVGATRAIFPKVRLIAATNRELVHEVSAGRFRADLYFRLAAIVVKLPPLRARLEDLPLVAESIASGLGADVRIQDDAIELLATHHFPGNFRELRNVLTRAVVLGGPVISARSISFSAWAADPAPRLPFEANLPAGGASHRAVDELDRERIREALVTHRRNLSAAAAALGVARSTLMLKIKRYGLER
ncbi:sigma 54-interacting transcriptional regulator [Myxococcota bacterium]|nr:sigma 54-interacting transcriptional regulator [Myxococcota bacterium]